MRRQVSNLHQCGPLLRERTERKQKMNEQNEQYSQGVYAGPLTQRATDYNGHEVIGVQVSDEAPDGACFFVTLDDHMQVSIAPVIAASIMPYEPAEPPPLPEIEPEDYEATRRSLEEIIARILTYSPQNTEELRTCALAMSELANVIDAQEGKRCAHAARAAGGACTAEVGTACRAADGSPDASQEAEIDGCTCGYYTTKEICGHTVFNDLGQPVGWVDIDLTGGTIDPDYAEDVR